MSRRRHRAGFSLIELLIVGTMVLLVGAALLALLRAGMQAQVQILSRNDADTASRLAMNVLADNLRAAKTVTAAAASDITYQDSAGNSIRYWKSGTDLLRKVNGSPSAGTVVARDLASLVFTYSYWSGTAWLSSGTPPTASSVGGVVFVAQTNRQGTTSQISGSARMRNVMLGRS